MSRLMRWIYRDMLDVYYDTEQPLPLDLELLCDQIGVEQDDERRVVERLLRLKFTRQDDGYHHLICDHVIAEYRKKADTARANGGKGGRPKKAVQNPEKPSGFQSGSDPDASGNPAGSGSQANQEPITKNQKPSKTLSSSGDDGAPFDAFWKAYPRKVGKQDAAKAWGKIKPGADLLQAMLDAITAQKEGADWRREDGEFIPHPATWLRGGRWLDEVRPYTPPPIKLPPGWWESKEGMAAAGAMLNPPLKPRQGEYPKEFAARIRVALGQVDAPAAGPLAPAAPDTYIPPAPPADVILTEEQREARRGELREQLARMKQADALRSAGVQEQPQRQGEP